MRLISINDYIKRNTKILIYLTILGTFAGIFLFNNYTDYIWDDYMYHFYWESYLPSPPPYKTISSIGDFFASQFNHWQHYNSRFVAFFFSHLFMQFPKIIFNIFNSIAFCALGGILYATMLKLTDNKEWNPVELLSLYVGMWFILPQFALTTLFLSGSCHYLWPAIIYMGLFYLYLHLEDRKLNIFKTICICIFAFFAGATNENSGAMMILVMGLLTLKYYLQNNHVQAWKLLIILTGLIGWLLIVRGPGSFGQERSAIDLSMTALISGFYRTYTRTFETLWQGIVVFTGTLTYASYHNLLNKNLKTKILILISGFLSGILSMILIDSTPYRTLFGPSLLLIIAIGTTVLQLRNHKQIIWHKAATILICFAFINSFLIELFLLKDQHSFHQEQINVIIAEKELNEIITVKITVPNNSNYSVLNYASFYEDEEDWFNRWIAAYYGAYRVRGEW
ncbi:MAG: DUF6056 family protein [Lachnospiraceae bacterium]|nr:DUF6056 family protein [Lachnospiraceae bacterium]